MINETTIYTSFCQPTFSNSSASIMYATTPAGSANFMPDYDLPESASESPDFMGYHHLPESAAQFSVSTEAATIVQHLEQIQTDPETKEIVYRYKEITQKETQVSISMQNEAIVSENLPGNLNDYLSHLRVKDLE